MINPHQFNKVKIFFIKNLILLIQRMHGSTSLSTWGGKNFPEVKFMIFFAAELLLSA